MKKTVLYAAALLALVIPLEALAVQSTGLGFTAPHVSDRSAVGNPARGDIIFESNDPTRGGSFLGYFGDGANDWVLFGDPAQQTQSFAAEIDGTATPPTITRMIGGNWLTYDRGTGGTYTFTFSGLNSAPICTATAIDPPGNLGVVAIVLSNAAEIQVRVWRSHVGSTFASRLNLVCIASP